MGRAMRKAVFGVPTRSDTIFAVQPQKMDSGLKCVLQKLEGLDYRCNEKMALLSCVGTFYFNRNPITLYQFVRLFEVNSTHT